jgi:hypothetical protein
MSVFVATQTYNRPKVSRACLAQQASVLRDGLDELHVWDDHSTFLPDLSGIAHVPHMEPCHLGPHGLRIAQLRAFLASDFDEVYLTDSDAVLDPDWIHVARYLSQSAPIVSLFNSKLHKQYTLGVGVESDIPYAVRAFAPGISYYMSRATVESVADRLDTLATNWDFTLPTLLGRRCAVSLTSYVDHYGAGGIHTPVDDWTRDMALNPTDYLLDLRVTMLPELR